MATYPYAGFWWRFVALLIDSLILTAGGFAIDFVISVAAGFAGMPEGTDVGVNYVINVVGSWLYFALQESSARQATVGKRCCRIFVTDIHGQRISFGRASGRHFAKIISTIILYIGFMMAGWTQRKQALHDMIAECLVWRRPEGVTALLPAGETAIVT